MFHQISSQILSAFISDEKSTNNSYLNKSTHILLKNGFGKSGIHPYASYLNKMWCDLMSNIKIKSNF